MSTTICRIPGLTELQSRTSDSSPIASIVIQPDKFYEHVGYTPCHFKPNAIVWTSPLRHVIRNSRSIVGTEMGL